MYADLMDDKLRKLERRAKEGNLQAAARWFQETCRTGDLTSQLEAMKLMGELQYPELFETLRMLEETEKLLQMPPVEDGYWTTEITISDNTGP